MSDTTPTDETPDEESVTVEDPNELQNVAGEADPNGGNELEEDVPAVETPAVEEEEAVPPSQEDQEKEAEAISEANRAAADAAEGA